MIFLAAFISVAKLFTIAYTRGTNVFTEYIDDLSVYFDKNIIFDAFLIVVNGCNMPVGHFFFAHTLLVCTVYIFLTFKNN